MARRVHIATDRAVITLPGFDAPNAPVEGISFDSSWPFTGLVMSRGVYSDPAPAHGEFATITPTISQYFFPLQRSRDGYTHYIVVVLEMMNGGVQNHRVFRGTREDPFTLAVDRKYTVIPGRPGEVRATGYHRFQSAVGFLVFAA